MMIGKVGMLRIPYKWKHKGYTEIINIRKSE
jgi:hypothetical protein